MEWGDKREVETHQCNDDSMKRERILLGVHTYSRRQLDQEAGLWTLLRARPDVRGRTCGPTAILPAGAVEGVFSLPRWDRHRANGGTNLLSSGVMVVVDRVRV